MSILAHYFVLVFRVASDGLIKSMDGAVGSHRRVHRLGLPLYVLGRGLDLHLDCLLFLGLRSPLRNLVLYLILLDRLLLSGGKSWGEGPGSLFGRSGFLHVGL